MEFEIPKIYPITDCRASGLSHAEQVSLLIKGGARFIQLREKHLSSRDFFAEAEKALKIARQHNVKIIINDRVDIALILKADGVHLGQTDLPPIKVRKILGKNAIIGFSTHNLEQVVEAVKMPIDYLAIGPVFNTVTKENPDPTIGLKIIGKIKKFTENFPLVAIGGITEKNIIEVFKEGANSCALISEIVGSKEKIIEKFIHLAEKIKEC